MFLARRMKSHKDAAGVKYIRPFDTIILRVFVDSYIELAIENSPDEAKPWATIISRHPTKLHEDEKKSPTISKAICATEA